MLKTENELLKKQNSELKKKLNNNNYSKNVEFKKLEEYYKIQINEKLRIIQDLTTKLNNIGSRNNNTIVKSDNYNYNNSLNGGKLVEVNFISMDQSLNCSFICNTKTKFYEVEAMLYEKYPVYGNSNGENYFMFNGTKIDRFKSLENNGITGYIIMLNKMD